MSKQLQHDFSHGFDTDIWEVLSFENLLLITTRDSEQLSVSFSLFDLSQKTFLWKNVSFEESWWISVYHFAGDAIVFQTYNDTQNIEARSVFGFDVRSMEATWAVEEVKLFNVSHGLLKMAAVSDPSYKFTVDLRTGEETAVTDDAEKEIVSVEALYPFHYEPESSHFETISKFLKEKLNLALEGSCDYLEWEDHFAITANSKARTGYNLDLFVFNLEGELLLHESLEEGLKGLATGTFFIVNQALIFVKGKRNLMIYGF